MILDACMQLFKKVTERQEIQMEARDAGQRPLGVWGWPINHR